MYNLMSCSGWTNGLSFLGPCSLSWLSIAFVVFLCLILRRQCEDGVLSGMGFNIIGSFIGGLGGSLLVITVFGSARWSLLIGVLGIAIGGFVVGMVYDTTGEGE